MAEDMKMNCFKRIAHYTFFVVLLSIIFTGHAVYAQANMILVDIGWLKDHLHDRNMVVVDARTEKEYLQGHIPTAINIPVMKTYSPVEPKDRVANLQHIKKLFSQAGIRNDQTIVIYDNNEYKNAGRLFWVFEVYGHENIKLLNGGFALWMSKKLPTSKLPAKISPSDYVPTVEPERLITRLDMRLAIEDGSKVIIDARTRDEYIGKKSEASRFGHIPHAENIPSKQNFDMVAGIKMLKPEDELRKIYGDLDGDKKIYTYCNKGKDSSLTYALLRQLGYDVAHYDGSWFEWGNDAALPIEQPQIQKK